MPSKISLPQPIERFAASAGINLRSALTFMASQPNFKRSMFWGGVLMIIFPPAGWIIALGYRSILFNRLIDNEDRSTLKLPEAAWDCIKIGCKAVFVIYSYYLPFLALFLLLGATDSTALTAHWIEVVIYFLLIPLFLPILMLGVPAYYLHNYDWLALGSIDYALLALVFAVTTFAMPGAFMQVGLYGRYRAAFCLRSVIAGIRANLRSYLVAWLFSGSILTLTVIAFPVFPWITFWAYLVFGFLFLNCAFLLKTEASNRRFQQILPLFLINEPPVESSAVSPR